MVFDFVMDKYPEMNKPLSAKYVKSFAYPTFKERIPQILMSVIQQLENKDDIIQKFGQTAVAESKEMVTQISNLMNAVQSDKPLTEIVSNSKNTCVTDIYNKLIKEKTEENGKPPSWFETEWLFAECYLYAKLNEIFNHSLHFTEFDPFLRSKNETLLGSKDAILFLSEFIATMKMKKSITDEDEKALFVFFIKCSLWGNKADLSLSNGKSMSVDANSLDTINEFDKSILVNDTELVYDILKQKSGHVIDIVLDNAGYELYNDLCLADFLLWSGIASKIIFHGKAIPWFVSDVTPLDFTLTMNLLKEKIGTDNLTKHVENWKNYLVQGKFTLKTGPFWIYPSDYSRMKSLAPELYSELSQNKLVIFKGDLNYRKLVGDIYWEPTTPYQKALRGFLPTNVLSLRTVKADTISGLESGVFEKLNQVEPDWMTTGKYALIQLAEKK